MMSDRDEACGCGKTPYEPPRLLVIDLAAEEVLLGGCKVGSMAGANAVGYNDPCAVTNCTSLGS
ncbi:MAG: hypothetical protein ACYC6T_16010 [Thermoleophilia bacterium]